MRIEKDGHYLTRGNTKAEVYDLRGAYCMGFVWTADGTRTPAIWRVEHGSVMNGIADRDLVEYVGPFAQPVVQ